MQTSTVMYKTIKTSINIDDVTAKTLPRQVNIFYSNRLGMITLSVHSTCWRPV